MKLFKCTIIFLLVWPVFNLVQAQVQIEKLSFTEALEKAGYESKVLMVVMDAKTNESFNRTATEGLRNENAFIINKQAVVIRPLINSADWDSLFRKYYRDMGHADDALGGLFFNDRGELIHRFWFCSKDPNQYFNQAFFAKRLSNLPNENDLLSQLKVSGYTDINLLIQLMGTRQQLLQSTDDLMAPFIEATPVDSFNSFRYFQVLARLCPVLHTKADSILRNSLDFNINWNMFEPGERQLIQHNINNKTIEKAVADKNYALAHYLIDSTINNSLENVREKDIPLLRVGLMSNFYWRVKDTVEYMRTAIDYADHFLMKLNVDSVKAAADDSLLAMKKSNRLTVVNNQFKPYGPSAPLVKYGSQLNFNAWQFYKMTNDALLKQKALGWIKRAIEFNVTPEAMGAYAILLYETGSKVEGITEQKKLIKDLKNKNRDNEIPIAEKRLMRMKSGVEKVDE